MKKEPPKTPNFKCSSKDRVLIKEITDRAKKLFESIKEENEHQSSFNRLLLEMDISSVMNSSTPIDLYRLSKFDDFNFIHDIVGIQNHINRETGELEHCFLPRSAISCQDTGYYNER